MKDSTGLAIWCQRTLNEYLRQFPHEANQLSGLGLLLAQDVDLRSRKTEPGHITASGMICDRKAEAVLLIHHGTLGKWLQPGGHVEGEEFPPAAARREVLEEVGIAVETMLSPNPALAAPIDIDSHDIPANDRKAEPAHTHHDFLFAFEVGQQTAVALQAAEVSDGQWMAYDDDRLEPRLRRIVQKLRTVPLWPISAE